MRLLKELKEKGFFKFIKEKIKKHGKAWWQWRVYKYKTMISLTLIRFRFDRIWFWGKWAEMCRWYGNHKHELMYHDCNLMPRFTNLNNKTDLWQFIIDHYVDDSRIHFLEFGVFKGTSLRWWTEHIKNENAAFWGFDSFKGLPEKFQNFGHGFLSNKSDIPKFEDKRIRLFKGLFQETLSGAIIYADTMVARRKIIHMDADVYSSTLFVLITLHPILKSGDIIIFDEFAHPNHEYRALRDFLRATGRSIRVIGASDVLYHVAVEIQ